MQIVLLRVVVYGAGRADGGGCAPAQPVLPVAVIVSSFAAHRVMFNDFAAWNYFFFASGNAFQMRRVKNMPTKVKGSRKMGQAPSRGWG